MWKLLIKLFISIFGIFLVVLGIYAWHLSDEIDKRFSGRRWSVPSRVYSDIKILYPGQRMTQSAMVRKLRRLGYREITGEQQQKGEFRISSQDIYLFLHDLDVPYRKRIGFPVRIVFSKKDIQSIVRLDSGEKIPILELEPEEITLFFGPERERRQLVAIAQVPKHLIDAVLAIEDNRFLQHPGLDPRGILRALYTNVRYGTIVQGGSTITQQLAKNYFLTPERTLSRKLKEALMAVIIELKYDKREILEIYLNEVYFGQKGSAAINGVGEASYFYFGKPVDELSLIESALIAGLIKAPNRYSPYVDKDLCHHRRNAVLKAMARQGWISDEVFRKVHATPTKTVGRGAHGKRAPYFIDYLSEQLKLLYSPKDLSSLGLSIYTTLDPQVQAAAEEALERGLSRLEESNPKLRRSDPLKRIQGAVVVMQPKTGYILAMVGGRNYNESQFNRVNQAKRQPGSAFKPFVFLSGLEKHTPASLLSNEPKAYSVNGKSWKPQNFEPGPGGRVRLREALAKSLNIATVDLAMRVGLDDIVTCASAFQLSTPIRPYPSLALGALEVIPLELARAYCAFAANGVLPHALSLKEVVNENGKVLTRKHMTVEQVTTSPKAFIMSSMLRSVVEEGTARGLKRMGISYPVAGKTGTTNGTRDAWFVGYTPDILALVWVGFDNGDTIHATGASAAMPIWADLMNGIPDYISGDWFKKPTGVASRILCSESGDLAGEACPKVFEEFFLLENVPTAYCTLHKQKGPFKKVIDGFKGFLKNL